ncbi:putative RNase H-like nuclease [Clostridium beijerinckii]|nr:putative RNase H-like nuclease [Clostridium beijerinckii]
MLNYEISNEKNKETLGKGISRQSFGIFNRIKEMNEFLNKLQIRKIINTKEYRKI